MWRGLKSGWFGGILVWFGIVWDDSGILWFGMHVRDCLGQFGSVWESLGCLFETVWDYLGQFEYLFGTVWDSLGACLGLF